MKTLISNTPKKYLGLSIKVPKFSQMLIVKSMNGFVGQFSRTYNTIIYIKTATRTNERTTHRTANTV